MSVGGSLPGALLVAMNRGGGGRLSPRPRVSGAGAARMSVGGSLPGALLVAMNRGGQTICTASGIRRRCSPYECRR